MDTETLGLKRQPGYEALAAYIDSEVSSGNGWLIAAIVCGWGLVMPPFIWLVKTAKAHHDMSPPAVTLLLGLVAAGVVGSFAYADYYRRYKTPAQRKARGYLTKLHAIRRSGRLSSQFSPEAGALLNQAALITMDARAALDSQAWQSATGARARARDDARASIAEAMSRVLVIASTAGVTDEAKRLVSELAEVAHELAATNRRMEATTSFGEGSLGLRSTLEQLREISRAEDEILENRSQF